MTRQVLDTSALRALATLSVGAILLLISLASKLTYNDLLRQSRGHAQALTLMDAIDGIVPKLRAAEKALTDYSKEHYISRWRRVTIYHWADPRESGGYLETARKKFGKVVDADKQLTIAHGEVSRLIQELTKVDIVRGQRYYTPLRSRIAEVRSICESKLSAVSRGIPRAVLSPRKKLRNLLKVTLIAGAVASALGLFFCWELVQ